MPYLSRRTFLQSSVASAVVLSSETLSVTLPSDSLRIAVIGTGQGTVNALASLAAMQRIRIALLAGASAAKLKLISGLLHEHEVRTPSLTTDLHRAIDDPAISALCFVGEYDLSAPELQRAFESGKAIFFDKPPALGHADLLSLADSVHNSKATVFTSLPAFRSPMGGLRDGDDMVGRIGSISAPSIRSALLNPSRSVAASSVTPLAALFDFLLGVAQTTEPANRSMAVRPQWLSAPSAVYPAVQLMATGLLQRIELDGLPGKRAPTAVLKLRGEKGLAITYGRSTASSATLAISLARFVAAAPALPEQKDRQAAARAFLAASLAHWITRRE